MVSKSLWSYEVGPLPGWFNHYYGHDKAGGIRVTEILGGRTGVMLGDGTMVKTFPTPKEAKKYVEAICELRN